MVDSGAAENVMPAETLANVQMMPKKKGIRFVAANGEEMENHGMKTVIFTPAEKLVGSSSAVEKLAGFSSTATGFKRQA